MTGVVGDDQQVAEGQGDDGHQLPAGGHQDRARQGAGQQIPLVKLKQIQFASSSKSQELWAGEQAEWRRERETSRIEAEAAAARLAAAQVSLDIIILFSYGYFLVMFG